MPDGEITVEIDGDDIFRQVMDTTQVKSGVMTKATRIAARARRIDAKDGAGAAQISIRQRPLPSGRFGVDVESDDVDGEYGTSERARIAALRRAVRGA